MINFKNKIDKVDLLIFICGLIYSLILFGIDLFSKEIIIKNISWGDNIPVIKGFFSISHVHNTGAAWGIFSDRTIALAIVTMIACMLIIYLIYASTSNKFLMICFSTVLGGAVGNLSERIFRGYVTDFLSFNIFGYNFPSFNFADICITIGCFLMIIYLIFFSKKDSKLFRDGTLASKIWGE